MSMESIVIRGVSLERAQAKVTISGVKDVPGTASRIFGAVGKANLLVDMIVAERLEDGNHRHLLHRAQGRRRQGGGRPAPVMPDLGEGVTLEATDGIAKLSVVGIGMRSHSGVAAEMFKALSDAGINIEMISTSEIKVTVTVAEGDIRPRRQRRPRGLRTRAGVKPRWIRVATALRPILRPCHEPGFRLWSRPAKKGALAQLVERLVRNEKVSGSIPLCSTSLPARFRPRRAGPSGGPRDRCRIRQGRFERTA